MKNKTSENEPPANQSNFRLLLRNPQTASDVRALPEPSIDKSSRPAALQLRHVEVPPHLIRRAWKLRLSKTLRRVAAKHRTAAQLEAADAKASLLAQKSRALSLDVAVPKPAARTNLNVAFATIVIWSAVVVLGIFAWRTRSPKAEPSFDAVRTETARSRSPSK